MAAQPELKQPQPDIAPQVSTILNTIIDDINAMPTSSTQVDMARSISKIPELEKAVRKLKIALTAQLVQAAQQATLSLK